MKTTTLMFLIGSAAIIGVGGLVFTLVAKPPAESTPAAVTPAAVEETPATAETTGSTSILDLMKTSAGKSIECTFVFTGSGMRSEGTGFFAADKARVDSLYSDADGNQTASYMIMDTPANTMYVWSLIAGEQVGMKLSLSENEKLATINPETESAVKTASTPKPISPESDVQYTCKPWSVDATVFIPPIGVQFADLSEMNKRMGEMMGQTELPAIAP